MISKAVLKTSINEVWVAKIGYLHSERGISTVNEYSVMKHNRTQSNLKERLSSITDTIEQNRTHNKNNLAERNRVPSARKAGKRKRPSRRENLWTTCNREGLVSEVLFF